jgi:hypothetical protein
VVGAIQKKRITDRLFIKKTIYKAILSLCPLKKISDFAIFSLQNHHYYSDKAIMSP